MRSKLPMAVPRQDLNPGPLAAVVTNVLITTLPVTLEPSDPLAPCDYFKMWDSTQAGLLTFVKNCVRHCNLSVLVTYYMFTLAGRQNCNSMATSLQTSFCQTGESQNC